MHYFRCAEPRLNCAPCPPFFVVDIYTVFVEVARQANLSETEIEDIRVRCDIDIPTTTTSTTTTTTTTTPTTTTATTRETTTETQLTTPTTEPTTATTEELHKTTKSSTATVDVNQTNTTSSSSSNFTDSFVTTTLASENSTTINGTVLVQEAKESSFSGCNDICVIAVATSAACLFVILLSLIAILLRRSRDESKRRSRSRSRNRFGDMPNTTLYDSIDVDLQDTSSYRNSVLSTTSLQRSADSSFSPFFDNPGYRRSLELRNSFYGNWYDPEATDYDYSQTMANLTRKSRSPEKSVSKSPAHDRRSSEKGTQSTGKGNHVSMREYVPKMIQNGDIPFGNNLPYCAPKVRNNSTGHSPERSRSVHDQRGRRLQERTRSLQGLGRSLQEKGRNHSPNRKSLPRTPMDNRKGPPDYEEVQRQRAFVRSMSYDPKVSIEYNSGQDGGYWTIETCKDARKRYVKNSQKDRGRSQTRRDQSVKSKLQRQQDDDVFTTGGSGHVYELQMTDGYKQGHGDPAILSSNLHPDYRRPEDHGEHNHGRNRSRKRERPRSAHGVEVRTEKPPSYRQLRDEPVMVYQTKL